MKQLDVFVSCSGETIGKVRHSVEQQISVTEPKQRRAIVHMLYCPTGSGSEQ